MNPTIIRLDAQASRIDHSAGRIDFWRSQAVHFQQEVAALTELCERLRNERDQEVGDKDRRRLEVLTAQDNAKALEGLARHHGARAREANKRADAREAERREIVAAVYGPRADHRAISHESLLVAIENQRALSASLTDRHIQARELAKLVLADVEIGGASNG